MRSVADIVKSGVCTGCGVCGICAHITFRENALGFPSPVVDDGCLHCGRCVEACAFDPLRENDD